MSEPRFRPYAPFDDLPGYEWVPNAIRAAEIDEHVAALEREARAVKAARRRRGFWRGLVMCVAIFTFLAVWAWLVNWLVPITHNPGAYGVKSTIGSSSTQKARELAYTHVWGA